MEEPLLTEMSEKVSRCVQINTAIVCILRKVYIGVSHAAILVAAPYRELLGRVYDTAPRMQVVNTLRTHATADRPGPAGELPLGSTDVANKRPMITGHAITH